MMVLHAQLRIAHYEIIAADRSTRHLNFFEKKSKYSEWASGEESVELKMVYLYTNNNQHQVFQKSHQVKLSRRNTKISHLYNGLLYIFGQD